MSVQIDTVQEHRSAKPTQENARILLLLTVFLSFCVVNTFVVKTPARPIEYPAYWLIPRVDQYHADEPRHIAQIDYMAHHYRLPPFETHKDMQLFADSYHPPCYYTVCAVLWAMMYPVLGWSGSIVLLRLFSCLMGAGTVYFTYRTARLLTSKQTALLAAACVAGIPMFVDVSASVSNETLSAFAAAVSVYYVTFGIKRGYAWRTVVLMSLWIAVGVSSKLTCVGLLPAAWYGLWWSARRRDQSRKQLLLFLGVTAGVSVLAVGWFLVRNYILYGDLFRLKVWEHYWPDIDGYKEQHRRSYVTWKRYLFVITYQGWISFWGAFDRASKSFPGRIILMLGVLHIVTLAGIGRLYHERWLRGVRSGALTAMGLMALVLLYEYYKFNWWHCSPSGRYFFPLLVPFGILMAAGYRAVFPHRFRKSASRTLVGALLVLNVYASIIYPFHPTTREDLPPQYAYNAIIPRKVPISKMPNRPSALDAEVVVTTSDKDGTA